MSIKSAWKENRLEVIASMMLSLVGLIAIADALRLHLSGPSGAAWTAAYIGVAGLVLIALALAALGSNSRVAAANTVTTRIASDILAEADDEEANQVREEPLPKEQAKSLLTRSIGLLVMWAVVVSLIGYVVSTVLFITAYGLIVSKRKIIPTLTLAVIATAAFYAAFHFSGITLPTGIFFENTYVTGFP